MQTPPQENYKRVQYVKVEKEDQFFSNISKKYKGRFYKNLKNGAGWSFPFEYKDNIDAERLEYFKSLSHVPQVQVQPDLQPKTTSNSIGLQTECNKNFVSVGTDPIKIVAPILKNKGINTCSIHQQKHNYKYDLPKGFERHYEFYKNLITACQEKPMFS